ncbi:MAG: AMP-binding protein [Acidobacteriota bacterium]
MMSSTGSPFPDPAETRTLPEVLERAGTRFGERRLGLYDGRGRRIEEHTFAELWALAQDAANRWRGRGLAPGDRVLVCLPSSWQWMQAWWGAALLGALPVAIAPAGAMGSSEGHTRRLAEVARRLGARAVVAPPTVAEQVDQLLAQPPDPVKGATEEGETLADGASPGSAAPQGREELEHLRSVWLAPEALAAAPAVAGPIARPEAVETAFLQLTSGSTGRPRAVRISHRAALHNGLASSEAIGAPYGSAAHRWADSMVSWLPLHHDMGLVGCLLLCLNLGLDLWLMNPTTFLARPQLWLQGLAERGKTFAPAPNFGYHLLTERLQPKALQDLDLSGFRAAMAGAEMVRPETVAAFLELTADTGFSPQAFRPCYGLAEATLAVTFDQRGEGLRTRPVPEGGDAGLGLSEVACVGHPVVDTEVEITTPDGAAVAEGVIGQVRVRGPGIFDGYFNDPRATTEGLVDGALVTGDLGFQLDGELYLTGRTKDVLILRGHNLMPHELEWLAEEVTGGGGAQRTGAFSIAQGAEGEVAVLAVETNERDPEARAALDRAIRQRLGRALSLTLADLVFVRRGRLPKTTSGKVQRRQLRQMYLDGSLDRLG